MKINKKQSIYLTAAALFGKKGFEGTSLDEVAQKAGVAKGTIFYHFQNKEELFSALIQEGVERLSQGVEDIAQKDLNIEEKLSLIVDFHFTFFKEHRDMCLMILGQIGNFQKRGKKSIALIRKRYLSAMGKIIEEAKAEKVIDAKLETESLIITLFSLLAVSGVDWAIFHPDLPEKKMAETVRTLLFDGFIRK
ncbi:MAG: TetR/AcrR family transcriptional regulator [Candidatus Paceibacterota bacterium]